MPRNVNIKQFQVKDSLNQEIWDEMKLRPEIRDRLLASAIDFIEFMGIKINPLDITITGSMANYNWSKNSDIDLHIIIDFMRIDSNVDLVKELFIAKKQVWNNKREVKIKGFDVEIYGQDIEEPHTSSGVYSVLTNRWITKPSKRNPKIDANGIKNKAMEMARLIDHAIKTDCSMKYLVKIKDKLKKMRQSGLDREGEFSVENLAFKALRRNGQIEKLINAILDRKNKMLSLEIEM